MIFITASGTWANLNPSHNQHTHFHLSTFSCVPGRKSSHAGGTGREHGITLRVSKKQAGEQMSVRWGWQVKFLFPLAQNCCG